MRLRKAAALSVVVFSLALIPVASSGAAPLPDNCTKDQGTVSCTEGPGRNQGGVGTTTETQGNTTNTSPEPQDLGTSCNPPSSQGRPCNP
jgi:hypothetical protein